MQSSSNFIENKACPECRKYGGDKKGDNLGVYTDHAYCWSCGYLEFYNYHNRRIGNVKESNEKIISLPEDLSPIIPAIADSWIRKYDLTLAELHANRVVWSEYRQLLIFPYFDDKHHLWGWQGRYFGKDAKHPKWTGKGNFKEQIKVYHPLTGIIKNGIILLTEDIISTIKTSRIYNSTCIYGSFVDINKYIKIYNIYKPKSFCIWLDKDKEKESRLFSLQFNKLGVPCSVVSTELDPKEYSIEEIRNFVESKTINFKASP